MPRNLGPVFTHIHDQEIEISERCYLDPLTLFALDCSVSPRAAGIHNAIFLAESPGRAVGGREERMFNIVKHRDLMLADDVPIWSDAERLRMEKYGRDYVVVECPAPQQAGSVTGIAAGAAQGQEACTSLVPDPPLLHEEPPQTLPVIV